MSLASDVTLTRRASGRLAVAWYTEDEQRDLAARRNTVRITAQLLRRFCVAGDVDLERVASVEGCDFALPPGRYAATAVLDTRSEFLETLFGEGDGAFVGTASVVEVPAVGEARTEVALTPAPRHPPPPERCSGSRAELMTIASPASGGRIGDNRPRRLCVRVPTSYERSPSRRYPVIFVLPGLGGTEQSGFAQGLVGALDSLADSTGREAIVVTVDTSTPLGSTYLNDSPVTGAWESFLSRTVIPTVEARFRTLGSADARALVGQSTGGFNAVSYGLRHSELFAAIAASSPDGLDFANWFLEGDGRHARRAWLAWMRLENAMGAVGQMTSYAADWSPNLATPRGFDWPVDLATGEVSPAVWARWLAHSPAELLRDASLVERVRARLSGRVYIAAGRHDEFDLFEPARRFSERLTTLGVANTLSADDEGHMCPSERARGIAGFLLHALPVPSP